MTTMTTTTPDERTALLKQLEGLLNEEDTQGHAFWVGVAAGLTANAIYDWLTSKSSMTTEEWFNKMYR